MRPDFVLAIPDSIRSELRAHAAAEAPNECCGILAGNAGRVTLAIPIRNDASSPTRYHTYARDLLNAHRTMREAGIEPLAIYHSHPTVDPIPSRTDLAENTWGESVAHVIIGPNAIRAWRLMPDRYEEVEISVEQSPCSPHAS